jgi:hypothetical protein
MKSVFLEVGTVFLNIIAMIFVIYKALKTVLYVGK